MTVEDRLTTTLHDLDRLEITPGDPHRALVTGARIGRRRTALRGTAVAAAVAVVVSAGVALRVGDDTGGDGIEPAPAPPAGWTELPTPPLSGRTGALAAWTGEEAIFLGGEIDNHCPPNADCALRPTYAKDGAAYDPDSDTWRSIAPAPVTVAAYTPFAVAGDVLVLVGANGWYAYDASDDRWQELPAPPLGAPTSVIGDPRISALDGRVYAISDSGPVQVLDLARRTWDTLPPSPHDPALEPHYVAATPEGIVVLGVDSTAPNDGIEPSLLLAEVYRDGSWERLPTSEILGGWSGWHWTGERLVSPYAECLDGGQTNNYGRCIPTGGALDPGTSSWAPLDPVPDFGAGGWAPSASAGPLVATWGSLYDDTDGSWTVIGPPAGAEDLMGVAGVIADGAIIAFGGIDWSGSSGGRVTDAAWVLTP